MTTYGVDPVTSEVQRALRLLTEGRWKDGDESSRMDLKEEAGRRGAGGVITPSVAHNEAAAKALAEEAACMANTDGGGALIVGAANDGTLIGTTLDAEWLRSRIYDLTQRALTVDVQPVVIGTARLLVVKSPQAIEPIRWNNKVKWRVDDRCVEIDPATWHARRMSRTQFDWSAQSSTVEPRMVRAAAIETARDFLSASGEAHARELAAAPQAELLRRLNVMTSDGYLTNAGVIAFVGRGPAALDYIRRDFAGADSSARIRRHDRALLEEISEVFQAVSSHNPLRHLPRGLAIGKVRQLPELAVREAVVNGVVHREWGSSDPTVVEHVGNALVVTSPGGFVGGVNPSNIITHPSQARNRALAELFAALRVAEREGIGVDRMVREMLRLGHALPDIREISGPFVRTSLVGDVVDEAWMEFLADLLPKQASENLNALLLLSHLTGTMWVDVEAAMPVLQLGGSETEGALGYLSGVTIGSAPVIAPVSGIPAGEPQAWHLTMEAVSALDSLTQATGRARVLPSRESVALSWARSRGRVSTTELGSIVGAAASNAGRVLKALEAQGQLRPGRDNRRGAGFFYVPAEPA